MVNTAQPRGGHVARARGNALEGGGDGSCGVAGTLARRQNRSWGDLLKPLTNYRGPGGGTGRPLARQVRSSPFVCRWGSEARSRQRLPGPRALAPRAALRPRTHVAEPLPRPTALSVAGSGTCSAWSHRAKPAARAGRLLDPRSTFCGPGPPQGLGGLKSKPGKVRVLWRSCPPHREG